MCNFLLKKIEKPEIYVAIIVHHYDEPKGVVSLYIRKSSHYDLKYWRDAFSFCGSVINVIPKIIDVEFLLDDYE